MSESSQESKEEVLKVGRDGAVIVLTLNRPDDLNSFDEALHYSFARFWLELESDPGVRSVVITGAGRAFCAGGSIDDFDLPHRHGST
jgi:enoyl-CoA hydratase